jgi:hypothetical protein
MFQFNHQFFPHLDLTQVRSRPTPRRNQGTRAEAGPEIHSVEEFGASRAQNHLRSSQNASPQGNSSALSFPPAIVNSQVRKRKYMGVCCTRVTDVEPVAYTSGYPLQEFYGGANCDKAGAII